MTDISVSSYFIDIIAMMGARRIKLGGISPRTSLVVSAGQLKG